ncbi:hypothetical protein [Massilia sp. S19_KUP03_FR1]|uniref:hypothetical protein n=1 Tax=Massilia sp. S19_KUP03_FR1 TaxID=3025503 RepID=UPI002FCCF2C8
MANEKHIKARVLVACDLGSPNDVIEINPATAKALADKVDVDPSAVKYAESLQ